MGYLYALTLRPEMKVLKSCLEVVFLLVMSVSCLDDPECFGLNNNFVGITFKNLLDGKGTSIAISSLTAETAADTLIGEVTTSKIIIPLDYFKNETSYTLKTADSSYRFVLGYTTQTQYVSEDCGVRYILSDLSIEEHSFDSVRLLGSRPGVNNNANNIEIFW